MGPITKTEALRECIAMWDWLAEHIEDAKMDYMRQVKGVFGDDEDLVPAFSCYACEYAFQQSKDNRWGFSLSPDICKHCPIWDQAHPEDALMCTVPGSPFHAWEEFDPVDGEDGDAYIARAAKGVADLARARLAEEEAK